MAYYNNFREILSKLCNNFKIKQTFSNNHFDIRNKFNTFNIGKKESHYNDRIVYRINHHHKDPLPAELRKIFKEVPTLTVSKNNIVVNGIVPKYYIDELKRHYPINSVYETNEECLIEYWNNYFLKKHWMEQFKMNILKPMYFIIKNELKLEEIDYIEQTVSNSILSRWKFKELNCFGEKMIITCYNEHNHFVVVSNNIPFNYMQQLAYDLETTIRSD